MKPYRIIPVAVSVALTFAVFCVYTHHRRYAIADETGKQDPCEPVEKFISGLKSKNITAIIKSMSDHGIQECFATKDKKKIKAAFNKYKSKLKVGSVEFRLIRLFVGFEEVENVDSGARVKNCLWIRYSKEGWKIDGGTLWDIFPDTRALGALYTILAWQNHSKKRDGYYDLRWESFTWMVDDIDTYIFKPLRITKKEFALTAVPRKKDGSRGFYLDQTGTVRFTKDGSEPNEKSDVLLVYEPDKTQEKSGKLEGCFKPVTGFYKALVKGDADTITRVMTEKAMKELFSSSDPESIKENIDEKLKNARGISKKVIWQQIHFSVSMNIEKAESKKKSLCIVVAKDRKKWKIKKIDGWRLYDDKAASEAMLLISMRIVRYQVRYGAYPDNLKKLGDVSLIDSELASGKKHGYHFRVTKAPKDKFDVIATPEKGTLGKSFFVD
jgi:hypothetical protein